MLSDLRLALRSLGKSRGFTAVALCTLALGIGLNTAIFSVVNTVLLRPLPYEGAGRLVHVWEPSAQQAAADAGQASLRNVADWRTRARSFEQIAAYRYWLFNLSGRGGAEALLGAYVSANLFPTLHARAAIGRTFLAAEEAPGAAPVAVISDALWRRRFGADPAAVGQSVTVNGRPHTIVGVMPAAFEFPGTIPSGAVLPSRTLEVWAPLTENPLETGRGQHNWWALGRLRDGVTVEQAESEMAQIGREQHAAFPEANETIRVLGLREQVVQSVRPALLLLLGAVAIVLVVACANVANLLLARGSTRVREMAVRAALGAGRGRLVRQLMAESVVLALGGCVLGLLLADWGLAALVRLAPPNVPRVAQSSVDGTVLAFAVGASLLTAVVFGFLPAFHAAAGSLADTLRGGGRGSTAGRAAQRSRSALVIGEVALSLVLLASSGLLLRSYRELQRVELGFEPSNVLTMFTLLPPAKYGDSRSQAEFYRRVEARLAAIPGVTSAASVNVLPLSGMGSSNSFTVAGRPEPKRDERPEAAFRTVSPDYFRTLGIRVTAGRAFTAGDSAGAPRVALVSETLVRELFPGESPIGHRLLHVSDGPVEIVGVAADIKDQSLDVPPVMTIYVPMAQQADVVAVFAARTTSDPAAIANAARAAVAAVDPEQPVMNVRSLASYLTASVEARRFTMSVLATFAAAALVLAAVGLYGVIAYLVGLRTQELGVRMALGAGRGDVLRLVLGSGLRLAGAGIALGVVGALASTRLLASQLYGVGPNDPATFAVIAAVLGLVALAASYFPARRATRVDPLVALRTE